MTEYSIKKYNHSRAHVKRRFRERFGLHITNSDYDELSELCNNKEKGYNDRRRDKNPSNKRDYRKIVVYKNIVMECIYNRRWKGVVTVYPLKNDFIESMVMMKYKSENNK